LVKGLKQQAKEQQQIAAKELAESKTLGKTVKDVLKFVKVLKDDLVDKLNDQKKLAEDTLKQAASKVMGDRSSGKPAARFTSDTDNAYDVDSFRKVAKNIDEMRGPVGAANDLIEDMRIGFNNVKQSAIALGNELYGHSILPEIQSHLQAIIDQLNTIKNDEDLLRTMASTAGSGESSLGGKNKSQSGERIVVDISSDLDRVFSQNIENLAEIIKKDREKFVNRLNEEFDQIRANLGLNASNNASKKGLENIGENKIQDALFEAFSKDVMLNIRNAVSTFGSLMVPAAVINIQQLNKEVNNLQGGLAGNVKLAREFRIETTSALQTIRAEAGFTIEEIGNATQQVMALGVSGPAMIAKQSKIMLMGARALGVEVSDVAQTYGLQARNLRLSAEQIPEMIAGTLRIARETGLTAKNVLEIRKETQAFSEELKRAGYLSAQLTNELTRTQAMSLKLGLGSFQQDLQKVFTDISQLGNVPDDIAIITTYVRNELANMDYSIPEILTGTMLTTLQGQRDFAKATKNTLQLLKKQAEAMGSVAGAASYLQVVSNGRIKSLAEIDRMIMLQTQASETQAEKAQRLLAIEKQLVDLKASGVHEALMGNLIAEMTGDTSYKTIEDVREAAKIAQQSIAIDQENLAADFMNNLIKRQAQIMSTTGISASEARDKAFQEMSGTIRGELAGMSIEEISQLAVRASQRAAEDVAKSAEAATDNMVDQIAQGVQKGIQMVAGPFADLVDFFDRMGIGPFVAGVAMFGTAAVLISASISSLMVAINRIRSLITKPNVIGDPTANDLMRRGTSTATFGTAEAGNAASAAGDAAIGSASQTAQTARTLSDYVAQIGDAGEELWKQKGRLMKGLLVITAIGVAIGSSIWLMSKVYPDAGVVMNVTASIMASTIAFATLIGAFHLMNTIGKSAQEVTQSMAKGMLVGLLALTAVGVLIGGAMHLLAWAFPEAGEVFGVAFAIAASAVAFTMLAVATAALVGAGLLLMLLTGPQALVALGAFALSLGVLAVTAIALGGAMALLIDYFPRAEEIIPVAKALAASALAFGVLAGAFIAISAIGLSVVIPMLFGPLGIAAVLGTIAAGISVLVGTARFLSEGINALRGMFPKPDKITEIGKSIEAASEAFDTLIGAYHKLTNAGLRMAALPFIGLGLPIVALWVLVNFAKNLNKALGVIDEKFRDDEEIQKTAKTIELASGAIKSLGEAYKAAVDSANLSWWKATIDLIRNKLAISSLLAFGKQLGPYIGKLQDVYGDMDQMQGVADRVRTAADVIKALASAGVELKKYKDETDGVFTSITPEDLTATMGDLTQIAESMGKYIPKIITNAPDASDAGRIRNAADAMKSISEMMNVTLDMQKKFGKGTFSSGPMDAMDTFMIQLGDKMSDPRGGFHALKSGIESMPAFREDEIKKLDMMNQATKSVFETLQTLGEINDEFPNNSTYGRNLGAIKKTLNLAVAVFNDNTEPLNNLKTILGMMPSDIGDRAVAFATMMETLKTSLLNIESLAKEFPKGSERSMEVMNDYLRYIASNLDQNAVQALSDTFAGVDLDLPNRIDAMSQGFERLPNLLTQIGRFVSRVNRPALNKAHDDIMFIARALAPLADLAESLTFEAPNIEHFEREIANLILTLGSATQAIPEVLELRSEIEAKVSGKGGYNKTTKTINDALTGPPGVGGTIGSISTIADLNDAMSSTNSQSIVMGGAENRLDILIKEQQQTNQLMRQLIAALVAPPVRQQQSGAAPRRTFPRTGATKQNVDSAWQSEEMLTTP
jgi:predicted RNase H-related nuclease YkuK (DUF458 family)